MKSLYYILKIDEKFHRNANILTLLSSTTDGLKSKSLAEAIDTNPQTMKKEVSILNSELKDYISIDISQQGMVTLTFVNTSVSVDYLIMKLARKSEVYKLIASIYKNKARSMTQMLLDLDTAKTKTYEIINSLNQVLAMYNIRISTKPCQFEGKESSIRIFLFDFFSVFGEPEECNPKPYKDMMGRLGRESKPPYLNLCHFRSYLWIRITTSRWATGNFIALDPNIYRLIEYTEAEYLGFKEYHSQLITYICQLSSLPEYELWWAYFTTLDCISYSESDNYSYESDNYTFVRDYPYKLRDEADALLSQVLELHKLPERCYDMISAFVLNLSILTQVDPAFEIVVPYQLKVNVKEKYETLCEKWRQALLFLPDNSSLRFTHIDDVAVSLTIMNMSIPPHEKDMIRVVFALQGDKGYDGYLAQCTRSILPAFIDASFFLERIPSHSYLTRHKIDHVISNYKLDVQFPNGCKAHMLPAIPSKADWDVLKDMLERL